MLTNALMEDLHSGTVTLRDFLSPLELRFREWEPSIHAFLPEDERFSRLRDEAEVLESLHPDPGNRPPLFGALAGIKDIFQVQGFTTQAGSRLPAEVLQGKEAESVRRLKEAGSLIAGKTVTAEFAYFTPGPTRNPHHLEHTPGGSSSGSAAAVAAGFCHFALGTQTIGSIVRPASFCGVVGVKPTYDRIPREGVIPLSPSLDHIGFFAANVESALRAAPFLYRDWNHPTRPLKRPQIGIPEGPYLKCVPEEGMIHFEEICRLLAKAGYEIQPIPVMDDFNEIRSRHDVILSAEAARVHEEWHKQYENLYSAKFTELIQRGHRVDNDQLQAALNARDTFRADLRKTFLDHDIDLWICPSTLGAAPMGLESTGDPVMNLPWTQAGLPAMNLPAGKDHDQLPLGLQVVGNWYKDESLLFWAKELEKALSNL